MRDSPPFPSLISHQIVSQLKEGGQRDPERVLSAIPDMRDGG